MTDELAAKYELLYAQLTEVIEESERRVISDSYDSLFENNVNFFVKSYLITICTYLEAFLQDIAFSYACLVNDRLRAAKIPHNYLYWKVAGEVKEKDLSFKNADEPSTKKEISDSISANPYKTIKTFKLLGVDLSKAQGVMENKELIEQIVKKRNNIIHHNDRAADVSFSDITAYIKIFTSYIRCINTTVTNSMQTNPLTAGHIN